MSKPFAARRDPLREFDPTAICARHVKTSHVKEVLPGCPGKWRMEKPRDDFAERGAPVVLCAANHAPKSVRLPMGHHAQGASIRA